MKKYKSTFCTIPLDFSYGEIINFEYRIFLDIPTYLEENTLSICFEKNSSFNQTEIPKIFISNNKLEENIINQYYKENEYDSIKNLYKNLIQDFNNTIFSNLNKQKNYHYLNSMKKKKPNLNIEKELDILNSFQLKSYEIFKNILNNDLTIENLIKEYDVILIENNLKNNKNNDMNKIYEEFCIINQYSKIDTFLEEPSKDNRKMKI